MGNVFEEENGKYKIACSKALWATDEGIINIIFNILLRIINSVKNIKNVSKGSKYPGGFGRSGRKDKGGFMRGKSPIKPP